MKILVTVKEVEEVEDDFEIDGNAVAETYLNYDLNEWDDYAVEEAVQLGEEHDDVEVVTVTIGPERSDETIRQALAKGADRAIRVWDDTLADLTLPDPVMTAKLLSAVIKEEDPDLVLSGVQSDDTAYGATGVALARLIDYQWAAVVNHLEVEPGAETASVHRELEGGVEELTDVDLPAVFTIQSGINEPRYASLRGIRQAQSKPLDVYEPSDLGLSAEDLTSAFELTSLYEPESETETTLFEGDTEEEADQLAGLLNEKGVVEG
jgi:electron transfer flavoprotein beta subunit